MGKRMGMGMGMGIGMETGWGLGWRWGWEWCSVKTLCPLSTTLCTVVQEGPHVLVVKGLRSESVDTPHGPVPSSLPTRQVAQDLSSEVLSLWLHEGGMVHTWG